MCAKKCFSKCPREPSQGFKSEVKGSPHVRGFLLSVKNWLKWGQKKWRPVKKHSIRSEVDDGGLIQTYDSREENKWTYSA